MPTKQHYVPNFILRNFVSVDGTLWIMQKDTKRCWARKGGGNDRYDAFAENEYLPQNVDYAFWTREHAAAPIISTILAAGRAGNAPCLVHAENEHLCRFLLAQILRVPRVKDFAVNLHAAAYYSMLRDNPCGDQDIDHPERAVFQKMVGMEVEVAVVKPNTGFPLLVSDEPCFLAEDKVVMRIAQDACLQLSDPAAFAGGYHLLDPGYVAALNRETLAKAQRFIAGPACEPIEQLVTRDR